MNTSRKNFAHSNQAFTTLFPTVSVPKTLLTQLKRIAFHQLVPKLVQVASSAKSNSLQKQDVKKSSWWYPEECVGLVQMQNLQ